MALNTKGRITEIVDGLRQSNNSLRELTDELSKQLQQSLLPVASAEVRKCIEGMLAHLERQIQLEERNGYLAEVLDQYPNWHPQVEHLRQQHALLHQQLKEMHDRVAGRPGSDALPMEIQRQVIDWINTYNEHQQRETALIQDAFTLETGVGE